MNKTKTCLFVLLAFLYAEAASAQTLEERISTLEKQLEKVNATRNNAPQLHGILRGKYEYQPDLEASRFEVRNARLSVDGNLPMRSSYKLEVDLCDESQIKMKDAWVRVNPWKTLRATIGQQRMPFSIDAHRNPSAQYFANRSFIAKQVGDMRDVGFQIGYDFKTTEGRKLLSIDTGVFNGSNLDNQKTAWFKSPGYSARVQYYPVKGLAIVPSIQHQQIADRKASYTSLDFGAYYEFSGLHLEAEYLRKHYAHDVFNDCNAVDAMVIWSLPATFLENRNSYIQGIDLFMRYDCMDNHSDGKKGFEESNLQSANGETRRVLLQSDAKRQRLTAGITFHVANQHFPTDIRLNYEKYWYAKGATPKESEQDKIVAELMIRF
ncbi:MAG: porin [Prevotellaceae bacterium]|nr:porin [Candidatus Minthosoma caballi]